jgi:hypothetical protein
MGGWWTEERKTGEMCGPTSNRNHRILCSQKMRSTWYSAGLKSWGGDDRQSPFPKRILPVTFRFRLAVDCVDSAKVACASFNKLPIQFPAVFCVSTKLHKEDHSGAVNKISIRLCFSPVQKRWKGRLTAVGHERPTGNLGNLERSRFNDQFPASILTKLLEHIRNASTNNSKNGMGCDPRVCLMRCLGDSVALPSSQQSVHEDKAAAGIGRLDELVPDLYK